MNKCIGWGEGWINVGWGEGWINVGWGEGWMNVGWGKGWLNVEEKDEWMIYIKFAGYKIMWVKVFCNYLFNEFCYGSTWKLSFCSSKVETISPPLLYTETKTSSLPPYRSSLSTFLITNHSYSFDGMNMENEKYEYILQSTLFLNLSDKS